MSYLERPLLIHVAAADEQRGRVVLAAQSGAPHPIAVASALSIARAFDTRIECLLVACPDVVALTEHSFARQVSRAGEIIPLAVDAVDAHQQAEAHAARRQIAAAAERAGVALTATIVRDALTPALARSCATEGPWNMIVLADPLKPGDAALLHGVLAEVTGATGVVCTGRLASATTGDDVLVVVEDSERLPQLLRVAGRLAALSLADAAVGRIVVLLAGGSPDGTAAIDEHLRLLLPSGVTEEGVAVVSVEAPCRYGTADEIAEAVRGFDARWLIVRSGGRAVPVDGTPAPLLAVMRCPLLVVR